jgi:hypothetical protein
LKGGKRFAHSIETDPNGPLRNSCDPIIASTRLISAEGIPGLNLLAETPASEEHHSSLHYC